jgi:hypothetical protein
LYDVTAAAAAYEKTTFFAPAEQKRMNKRMDEARQNDNE